MLWKNSVLLTLTGYYLRSPFGSECKEDVVRPNYFIELVY